MEINDHQITQQENELRGLFERECLLKKNSPSRCARIVKSSRRQTQKKDLSTFILVNVFATMFVLVSAVFSAMAAKDSSSAHDVNDIK